MTCLSLTSQRPLADLVAGLRQDDVVVYRDNGNRTTKAEALLPRLEALLPLIGVTRVGEISHLAANRYPVFQSARPKLLQHPSLGQNGGSQGKGNTPLQAKISCIMESIEGYCAEPRAMQLIRGSYTQLARQHALLDPRRQQHRLGAPQARLDEPLMWTEAYHVGLDAPVLVPAESIYSYLVPAAYRTVSHFSASSNGLAAGATYLEAVIHGLYEVIERFYLAMFEVGGVEAECLMEFEYEGFDIEAFNRDQNGQFQLLLFALRFAGLENLPLVVCRLIDDDICPSGYGCCSDVETAIGRAVSEALQAYATGISGTREDISRWLAKKGERSYGATPTKVPDHRTMWISEYKEAVIDRTYDSLRAEYEAVVAWLGRLGFGNILIANLTRVGLDVPVVKVYVEGLPSGSKGQGYWSGGMPDLTYPASRQFSFAPAYGDPRV